SVYLPGAEHPMLPSTLAHEEAALRTDRQRPARVCEIRLGASGEVLDHQWHRAMVQPRARYSHEQLSTLLADEATASLTALDAAAAALRSHRRTRIASMPERPDYHLQLDEQGRLQDILQRSKSRSHQLVEECMLAVNRCAASELTGRRGLFVAHGGFRPERLG